MVTHGHPRAHVARQIRAVRLPGYARRLLLGAPSAVALPDPPAFRPVVAGRVRRWYHLLASCRCAKASEIIT